MKRLLFCLALLMLINISSFADDKKSDAKTEPKKIDFNRDIRPILSNNCIRCHGPDKETLEGDLRLDKAADLLRVKEGHAAVVPGSTEKSELFKRITSDDSDMVMPPKGKGKKLSDKEIALIKQWISEGGGFADHWSYAKPLKKAIPEKGAAAIDYFIRQKLLEKQLKMSPLASKEILARRVSLDLTGLPPTVEQLDRFLKDTSPRAYENYVDSLIASPAYGERWGAMWLDLARYADSCGYASDEEREIWLYRDWVIKSFNENMPFDQFTIEQLAGDLLPNATESQKIATAFHRNTKTNSEGGTNDEEFRNEAVVDRVNTTMQVWMGTTMSCAQCHNHKYDPISQKDYFKFYAILNQTADADIQGDAPLLKRFSDQKLEQKKKFEQQLADIKGKLSSLSHDQLKEERENWIRSMKTAPVYQPVQFSGLEGDFYTKQESYADGPQLKLNTNFTPEELKKKKTFTAATKWKTDLIAQASALKLDFLNEKNDGLKVTEFSAAWQPENAGTIASGQFIRISLAGEQKMIHLAEVEAFHLGKNVALKAKATASSEDYDGKIERITDGNTEGEYSQGSVCHTKVESNPFVEVDLGKEFLLEEIKLWNRTDNGQSMMNRFAGAKVELLDAKRKVVFSDTVNSQPPRTMSFNPNTSRPLKLKSIIANSEDTMFKAETLLSQSVKVIPGWSPDKSFKQLPSLFLILEKPEILSSGELTIRINFETPQSQKINLSVTQDPQAYHWAKLPEKVAEQLTLKRPGNELLEYYKTLSPQVIKLNSEIAKSEKELSTITPDTVPVMVELPSEKKRKTHIQLRGNFLNLGEEVGPDVISAFHKPQSEKVDRLVLAKWLVDRENSLTPRVVVNRFWEQIFGTGIVMTSEEFGSQGDPPTHQELLDYLAVDFVEHNWDMKYLLKTLVMSETYQQSSVVTPQLLEADPTNRFYARGPRVRISAEMVRDQALAVSGLLSKKMYGPPVRPPQPDLGLSAAFGRNTDWKTSAGEDRYRRAIYTMWQRSNPYPSMTTFDAPEREVCTIRRIQTNTPLQALVTMNDPVYIEAARSFAGIIKQHGLDYAFHKALLRHPGEMELKKLTALYEATKKEYESHPEEISKLMEQPKEKVDPDLAAWTVVANVILNLDELFMKK